MIRSVLLLLAAACGEPDPEDATPAPPARPDAEVFTEAQEGGLLLGSADSLAFAAAGYLVIGDGAKDRLVVVETNDYTPDPTAADWGRIPNLASKVAAALGAAEDDVEINDVAVNPLSGRTWVAARRQDTEFTALFTVEADNSVALVDLSGSRWAGVGWPAVSGAGSVVTDLEATSTALVAAVTEVSWTQSQVVAIELPFAHGAESEVTSTRTYHRTHQQWETLAPITTLFAYEEGATTYVGASYQCAPVVRFTLDELLSGDPETVGVTPYDYGPLRQVEAFAVGGGSGDRVIYAGVSNLGGTATEQALFEETGDVDEAAPIVFTQADDPAHDLVSIQSKLEDAVDIEILDAARLVVHFDDGSLEVVDQP